MTEILTTTVDKFTFRVPTDRFYDEEGLWVRFEGQGIVSIGLGDFLQQSSGDVAFAEVKPAGTTLEAGQPLASIETMKVTLELSSPIPGTVAEANPALTASPEIINQDPYGRGWLARIRVPDWESARSRLLEAKRYLVLMKGRAEAEAGKS